MTFAAILNREYLRGAQRDLTRAGAAAQEKVAFGRAEAKKRLGVDLRT
jgi:hypothetical protein